MELYINDIYCGATLFVIKIDGGTGDDGYDYYFTCVPNTTAILRLIKEKNDPRMLDGLIKTSEALDKINEALTNDKNVKNIKRDENLMAAFAKSYIKNSCK